jgi:hypothetical protein
MQFTTHYIEKLPHFLPYKPLSDFPARKIHIGSRTPILRVELDGRFCRLTSKKKQAEENDKKKTSRREG